MKYFMINLLRTIKKILSKKTKVSGFAFDNINRLYYSSHKVTLNQGNLYLKSKNWSKNKETKVSLKRR